MSATTSPTLVRLRQMSEQGWLRRLDSAIAGFVQHHDKEATPVLLWAASVLTHMEGKGHTCLPLEPLLADPQAVLGWPDKAQQSLADLTSGLPTTMGDWVKALQRSPTVRHVQGGAADLGQPLVLSTVNGPTLYLRRYWMYEQTTATAVDQRAGLRKVVDTAKARYWLDRLFPAAESQPQGTDWQKIACALSLRSGLTIITGGPGTGKTYTAARLLALLLAMSDQPEQLKVALAAPTGKAAARLRNSIDDSLSQVTQIPGDKFDLKVLIGRIGKARTIHSLLGMHIGSREFRHNASHPLDVDVLIVDETSMIHLEMMAALLQALPPNAKLILLGDKDQLKSVEPGAVLGSLCAHAEEDLYDAETCSYLKLTTGEVTPVATGAGTALDQQTVMLRHSHRFGSAIGQLAKAVNDGIVNTTEIVDVTGKAILHLGAYELLELCATSHMPPDTISGRIWLSSPLNITPAIIVQLALQGRDLAPANYRDYLELIRRGPSDDASTGDVHGAWVKEVLRAFDRFRILCAVHDGDWGDYAINHTVQAALAQGGWLSPEGEWFIGRPVMVTRNEPTLGVFNGDIGIVLPASIGGKVLRAYFLDGDGLRSVSVNRLAHVETAFAMTIHKSQGSEFAHTVVVLPETATEILTRELVYTGITRAKEYLSIIEPKSGLLGQAIGQRVMRASGVSSK